MVARFCLVFDVEGEFGRLPIRPNKPVLSRLVNTASMIFGVDYSIKKFKRIVTTLERHRFPSTFFFVGALLHTPKEKDLLSDYLSISRKTNYLFKSNLLKRIPSWGTYIEKNLVDHSLFELGNHTFLHECVALESKEVIEQSLAYSRSLELLRGFTSTSFSAPWHMLDNASFDICKLLKEQHFKIALFAGKNKGVHLAENFAVKKPTTESGIKIVHISLDIGTVNFSDIEKDLRSRIEEAIDTNSICCVLTHDNNIRDIALLEKIVALVSSYNGKIVAQTLSDALSPFR